MINCIKGLSFTTRQNSIEGGVGMKRAVLGNGVGDYSRWGALDSQWGGGLKNGKSLAAGGRRFFACWPRIEAGLHPPPACKKAGAIAPAFFVFRGETGIRTQGPKKSVTA